MQKFISVLSPSLLRLFISTWINAETCRSFTTRLNIIVSNYSAIFWCIYIHTYIYMVTAASVVWWLACRPLVPKIAGSIPAEAVGFFGRKNPQ